MWPTLPRLASLPLPKRPGLSIRRQGRLLTSCLQWAVEMGFEFPTAKVLGTDLSAIQPTDVPPNVEFYVEDT